MTPKSPPDPHNLIHHTQRYATTPHSPNAHSNFTLRLHLTTDPTLLRQLTQQYALEPQIAIPLWLRLEALSSNDPATILDAAVAYYSFGHDEEALQRIEQLLTDKPDWIPALELKAALTPDPRQRKHLYDEILRVDPGNQRAIDQLILLERS